MTTLTSQNDNFWTTPLVQSMALDQRLERKAIEAVSTVDQHDIRQGKLIRWYSRYFQMNGPYLFFRFGDTELAFLVIGIDKILEDRVTFPKGEIRVPRPHQEKKKKHSDTMEQGKTSGSTNLWSIIVGIRLNVNRMIFEERSWEVSKTSRRREEWSMLKMIKTDPFGLSLVCSGDFCSPFWKSK